MTDWLAIRGEGSIIDFRLAGDPAEIPKAVLRARTNEYYGQVKYAMRLRSARAAAQGKPTSKV